MKVHELLLERIYISDKQETTIASVFDKWLDKVQQHYKNEGYQKPGDGNIAEDYKMLTKNLRLALSNVVRSIIKPYFPSSDVMQRYIDDKRGIFTKPTDSLDNFMGHMLHIDIYPYISNEHGSIEGRWSKLYGSGKTRDQFRLHNTLSLSITPRDISMALSGWRDEKVSGWVSTLTHEITHLIQTLKSSQQRVHHKKYHEDMSSKEQYLSSDHEIDAYAQSVASSIINKARRSDDPHHEIDTALRMMRYGIRTVFNREMFPGHEYDDFRELFLAPTKNEKHKRIKQRTWRRFQQALVSKLLNYKGQLR